MTSSRENTIHDCSLISLSRHHHENGNLTVVEDFNEIPFKIKRVFYLYDIPGGEDRGGHAHKALYQFIVAISGSFTIDLHDGRDTVSFTLNRPFQGLLVAPGVWNTLHNFSSGSVCAVICSDVYDESDYIRNFEDFLTYKSANAK
ncbi:MAG: FdtA/QdtA family cupin domain-containing protein [Bacteroidales bacterium]|nr:FdtA/QdtA family cupin domain-containing protein [Bacteroidales bacterium]